MTPVVRVAADHITFTDGHAWLVIDATDCSLFTCGEPAHCKGEETHDRPCDWCHGEGEVSNAHDGTSYGDYQPCGCIDGRHTFEIEVGEGEQYHSMIYRVSIVPGMVLPIIGYHDPSTGSVPDTAAMEVHPTRGGMLRKALAATTLRRYEAVTLPPAATPGMWAVKLKVAT